MTREKKIPRPDLSIQCCECGGRSQVSAVSDWRSQIDREMKQMARMRECVECGKRWRTLELSESEVQELRRKAHLYLMAAA